MYHRFWRCAPCVGGCDERVACVVSARRYALCAGACSMLELVTG